MGIVVHVLLTGFFPFLNEDKEITKRNIVFERINIQGSSWKKVSDRGKAFVL